MTAYEVENFLAVIGLFEVQVADLEFILAGRQGEINHEYKVSSSTLIPAWLSFTLRSSIS